MGNEFCKGCQDNCLSGTLEQDFSNKNKPEENIIYQNTDYINTKTNPSILYTNNQINENGYNNYINLKTSRIYNNIDKKKLNDIILNYRVRILTKYFRKFKFLKQKILKKIIVENNYISSDNTNERNTKNNNNKINNNLDIDILPKENHIFIGHKFNNKKEGFGLEIYSEINARFLGQFKNGKKNGYCRYSMYNTETSFFYIGEALNNKICGYGYYENSKKGTKYEGQWKNSMRNGYGIEHYEEGSNMELVYMFGRINLLMKGNGIIIS